MKNKKNYRCECGDFVVKGNSEMLFGLKKCPACGRKIKLAKRNKQPKRGRNQQIIKRPNNGPYQRIPRVYFTTTNKNLPFLE